MTTPKIRKMALAYRIYCDCEMWGWNRTIREIAETVGEDYHRVRGVIGQKGWSGRVKIQHYRAADITNKLYGAHFLSEDVPAHMILDKYI